MYRIETGKRPKMIPNAQALLKCGHLNSDYESGVFSRPNVI